MRRKAKSGELRQIKDLLGVLLTWKRWTDNPAEVNGYVAQLLVSAEESLDFLAECLYQIRVIYGSSDRGVIEWSLNLKNLSELTDIHALERLVLEAEQKEGELSDRQKLAIEVFTREMRQLSMDEGSDQPPRKES